MTSATVMLRCGDCGEPIEWTRRPGRRPRRCTDCAAERQMYTRINYVAEPDFAKARAKARARVLKLKLLGERKEQELAMLTLAKRSGELGKVYTQIIRAQQTLDRQPYAGREHNAARGEALRRLNEAEHALGQLLLLDDDKA